MHLYFFFLIRDTVKTLINFQQTTKTRLHLKFDISINFAQKTLTHYKTTQIRHMFNKKKITSFTDYKVDVFR